MMRKTYIYSANIKLTCLHLYLLRNQEIERVNNFDILSFIETNIFQFVAIFYA